MGVGAQDRFWVGVDPGGADKFGIAWISENRSVVRVECVSCADDAIALIQFAPLGVGVDAPLWWSSGRSSDRHADRWIRATYRIASGTVQTANSLRGAALVQAAMFVTRLREKFSGVRVTEAHPKALALAMGGWPGMPQRYPELRALSNEHQRDAALAAIAAREGYEGRWKRNLALDRSTSEQNPFDYWLAPIDYFWPE